MRASCVFVRVRVRVYDCVRACVRRACVRACVRAGVRACARACVHTLHIAGVQTQISVYTRHPCNPDELMRDPGTFSLERLGFRTDCGSL